MRDGRKSLILQHPAPRFESFNLFLNFRNFSFSTMSQVARVYSLLGDSNVQRNMNSTNCRDRPLMNEVQVIPCGGRTEVLAEGLRQVRSASNVVLLSCVTNFITSSEQTISSVSNRVEPILREFRSIVEASAMEHTDRLFLISPPMYRSFPVWYRDGISEVLQKFSSMMSPQPNGPINVHLLPSFSTPSFEADGVHLTPYSGLEFILHLFDSASAIIKTLTSTPEEVVIKNVESSRVLEDRMMAIEQDHRRLNRVVEDKTAEDSELADFLENTRYEDHFIVLGLPHIPKCDTRVWQDKAKRLVGEFIHKLIGWEPRIVFIKNISGKAKDSPARYQVQMESVAISRKIRDKFGTFFPKGKDSRPDPFKKISVRNRLTHETRVRFNIMKVLAQHWQASNPGSKIQCIGYDSRPTIRLFPAENARDRRVLTLNFIEAVRTLPVSFSPDELEMILSEVKPKWVGKLRSLFVVLSDDMIKRKFRGKTAANRSEESGTEADASSKSARSGSRNRGDKRGHDAEPEGSKSSKSSKSSKHSTK